ncbi:MULTISPECIES: MarR family winged helix-turn-helix transcriptional regulator [Burkholderia cepacia complex]|uniref:MarR family winged helix-turn-helix transcriptional regulator n=1 Tax=Burkholderia cepacia complex TaxID=87882 RepID=UPI001E4515D4|nr:MULTISPECIES: MarR family transcriptional regulator [Burkholderia cepacia complex]
MRSCDCTRRAGYPGIPAWAAGASAATPGNLRTMADSDAGRPFTIDPVARPSKEVIEMSTADAKQPARPRTGAKKASTQTEFAPKPSLPRNSLIELITLQWQHERSDLDLSNFLLAIYFMRLGTLVEQSFDKMCQRMWGISGSDMRVLLALRRSGHPYAKRPTDLYRALLVTSGAITKKIDRLASLGMVERQPDPSHAGGFIVHLTRKGLDVVEKAVVKLANESSIAPAMAHFSDAERAAGNEFCLRTLALMEETALQELDDAPSVPSAPRTRQTRRTPRSRK